MSFATAVVILILAGIVFLGVCVVDQLLRAVRRFDAQTDVEQDGKPATPRKQRWNRPPVMVLMVAISLLAPGVLNSAPAVLRPGFWLTDAAQFLAIVAGLLAGAYRLMRRATTTTDTGDDSPAPKLVRAIKFVPVAAACALALAMLISIEGRVLTGPAGDGYGIAEPAPARTGGPSAQPPVAADAWDVFEIPGTGGIAVVEDVSSACVLHALDEGAPPVGSTVRLHASDGRLVVSAGAGSTPATGANLGAKCGVNTLVEVVGVDGYDGRAYPRTLAGEEVRRLQNGNKVYAIAEGTLISLDGTTLPQGIRVWLVYSPRLDQTVLLPASLINE